MQTTKAGNADSLDEQLFRAWQAGDPKARERVWTLLWTRVYTAAVRYCRCVGEPSTAQDSASIAFMRAMRELDPGGCVSPEWHGEPQLVAYVCNRVILRCRDALRVEWRWINHLTDADEHADEDGDLFDVLAHVHTPATQAELVPGELLRRVVRRLAVLHEICAGRQSLLDVVSQIREYVRECFIAAGEQATAPTDGGRSWASLTLDELADLVEPHRVEIARAPMYAFVRKGLGLESDEKRNILYLRMREIRALLAVTSTA